MTVIEPLDLAALLEQVAEALRGKFGPPVIDVPPAEMHINAAGVALIKQAEGLRLEAYQDQRGKWTIGYGHTENVSEGDVITAAEAEHLFELDVAIRERVVASVAAAPSNNEFAAMVSLTYNIGADAFVRHSTVLRKHNLGDKRGAADAFLLWNKTHIDGVLVTDVGLTMRRKVERELYLTPDTVAARTPGRMVAMAMGLAAALGLGGSAGPLVERNDTAAAEIPSAATAGPPAAGDFFAGSTFRFETQAGRLIIVPLPKD